MKHALWGIFHTVHKWPIFATLDRSQPEAWGRLNQLINPPPRKGHSISHMRWMGYSCRRVFVEWHDRPEGGSEKPLPAATPRAGRGIQ